MYFLATYDLFSEKTNREGFYENKAFIDLKKILRTVLVTNWAGKRVSI